MVQAQLPPQQSSELATAFVNWYNSKIYGKMEPLRLQDVTLKQAAPSVFYAYINQRPGAEKLPDLAVQFVYKGVKVLINYDEGISAIGSKWDSIRDKKPAKPA
jgi:hypothetical protein